MIVPTSLYDYDNFIMSMNKEELKTWQEISKQYPGVPLNETRYNTLAVQRFNVMYRAYINKIRGPQ